MTMLSYFQNIFITSKRSSTLLAVPPHSFLPPSLTTRNLLSNLWFKMSNFLHFYINSEREPRSLIWVLKSYNVSKKQGRSQKMPGYIRDCLFRLTNGLLTGLLFLSIGFCPYLGDKINKKMNQ